MARPWMTLEPKKENNENTDRLERVRTHLLVNNWISSKVTFGHNHKGFKEVRILDDDADDETPSSLQNDAIKGGVAVYHI